MPFIKATFSQQKKTRRKAAETHMHKIVVKANGIEEKGERNTCHWPAHPRIIAHPHIYISMSNAYTQT